MGYLLVFQMDREWGMKMGTLKVELSDKLMGTLKVELMDKLMGLMLVNLLVYWMAQSRIQHLE